MLFDSFNHAMQDESAKQDSVEIERFWNLQRSKFVNYNDAKLTDARTKMEVGLDRAMIETVSSKEVGANVKKSNTDFGISIWNMEYGTRNMSILIPCQ